MGGGNNNAFFQKLSFVFHQSEFYGNMFPAKRKNQSLDLQIVMKIFMSCLIAHFRSDSKIWCSQSMKNGFMFMVRASKKYSDNQKNLE